MRSKESQRGILTRGKSDGSSAASPCLLWFRYSSRQEPSVYLDEGQVAALVAAEGKRPSSVLRKPEVAHWASIPLGRHFDMGRLDLKVTHGSFDYSFKPI